MAAELLLASRRCSQCLTTRNRIVTGQRAAELVKACRTEDNHFFCHKGTLRGGQVHCRGVHQITGGGRAYRMAEFYNIPIVEVDPDSL